MEFRQARCDDAALQEYLVFFQRCFPHARHYSIAYLRWLYRENPTGSVFGYDAYDGGRLAAHYVCIPTPLRIEGATVPGALSLDTATDPEYQGRGLFTKLATRTYERSAELGHRAVIGVANRNSTPGMVRRLGFQLVSPLDAQIGIGSLDVGDWNVVEAGTTLRRSWTPELLSWRLHNPSNPVGMKLTKYKTLGFFARTFTPGISCWAERRDSSPKPAPESSRLSASGWHARLFIGLFPEGAAARRCYVGIPDRLRRSPLNFIYKPLTAAPASIDGAEVLFDFLDFDAF